MKKYKNGFTMMEMLVVVSIIGVLMAMLFPAIAKVRENVKIGAAKKDIQKITTALMNYMADFGDYPPEGFNLGAGRINLSAPPTGHDGTNENAGHTQLSEVFLLCLTTKSKNGPYLDIPAKYKVDYDGDYYDTSGDTAPNIGPTNSVWNSNNKTYLYEYLDPWGNPYRYFRTDPSTFPSSGSTANEAKGFDFWIVSNGPDGKPGFAKGSKEKPDGDDDGEGSADEVNGTEDGAKVLYGTPARTVYSDDVVNWR